MIWVIAAASAFAALVALYVWVRGKLHAPARAVVEKELSRIFERASDEKATLVDPSKPIDIQEAIHDLRQTRDRGRPPE